ncbi:M23 family metallopeptidase [Pseudomonas juntendi]|uniref:M23 family metallopeptidase n=1 Tax=Pseudomonas juntendi TaxID=2666183 RepID=A0ABZ2JCL5_9PSED|nr:MULTISPECIES: M23 family metallopeptidase [Pseudomonas]MDG9871619.1 M23 family metallopeptidase [Pseudomonas juntendi]MDH2017104.1 M23 family metallopeptidase [Pseudomonas juntendi]QDR70737.1 M23 family metallopeptidase [Pseudomonas sp. BJP69]WHL29170.1 M23 family metallopeptidase [Pseudomonas juntendi]
MPGRLLLFCALFMASASSLGVTLYKSTDESGVISYSDRPGPGARPLNLLEPMVETLEGQVFLNAKVFNGGVSFSARNQLHVPVEVELRLDNLVNAQGGDAPRIVRRLLPPGTTQMLSVLRGRPGLLLNYRSTLLQAMGDPGKRPQGFRYGFAWLGGPFRVTQGPNGRVSHFGPKGRYAMDIAMPEGTTIIAAREGVVVKTQNDQSGREPNPSGNFVRVLHSDGTMGVYLHLMRDSVVVKEGQRVRQGQMLAKSGNTGNSTGPHLHFVVQRNVGLALESIPYRFDRPLSGLPDFTAGNP